MARTPRQQGGKKHGKAEGRHKFKALVIEQDEHKLYSFVEKASKLWSF